MSVFGVRYIVLGWPTDELRIIPDANDVIDTTNFHPGIIKLLTA